MKRRSKWKEEAREDAKDINKIRAAAAAIAAGNGCCRSNGCISNNFSAVLFFSFVQQNKTQFRPGNNISILMLHPLIHILYTLPVTVKGLFRCY